MQRRRLAWSAAALAIVASLGVSAPVPDLQASSPQDRFAALPGFEAYRQMQEALRTPVVDPGVQNVVWADDSQSVTYRRDGRARRFDLATRSETEAPPAAPAAAPGTIGPTPCPRALVDRGRQSPCAPSPDRSMKAFYRDRNLVVSRADGGDEILVTTDGSAATRVKYGTASWVYGEELDQVTAIWWSPDGRKVAFYRMDEHAVPDYYVLLNQLGLQNVVDVEAYPKAGSANPVADVLVYDLASRRTVTLDVRDGRPFSNDVVGHYVYGISWAPDSTEVRLYRTNRLQNVLELAACAPDGGRCRTIVRETRPTGWVDYKRTMRPLADGRRFLWASDRSGWRNYDLYEFSGRLINPVTTLRGADAGAIVTIDERAGTVFYLANDGDAPLKTQLHRVRLDGTAEVRLTDPAWHHRVSVSPDGRRFVDVAQRHDTPAVSRIAETSGADIATIGRADLARFRALKLRTTEQFTYTAADGATTLYGSIAFPSAFDPARAYPVWVAVYGGPDSAELIPTASFEVPSARTELGFLVVTLSSRAMPGLGRAALDALYRKLGQTELDDLVAGVRALASRPYVDRERVGISGTSYGGYLALMAVLRYPDVFAAAAAASPVTDWRLYDTIYTERYMGLPDDNREGYEKGSAMTYAAGLRAPLLLYYGTADNNVHPANALQLVDALRRAGKRIELEVGPDEGHSGLPPMRLAEFFVEHLLVGAERRRTR